MPESGNLPCVAVVDYEAGMIRTYGLLFKRRNIPVAYFAMTGRGAGTLPPGGFAAEGRHHRFQAAGHGRPDVDEQGPVQGTRYAGHVSGDITVGQKCQDSGAAAFFRKPTGIRGITDTVSRLLSV